MLFYLGADFLSILREVLLLSQLLFMKYIYYIASVFQQFVNATCMININSCSMHFLSTLIFIFCAFITSYYFIM